MKAIYKNKIIAESDETIKIEGNHYFSPDSITESVKLEDSPTLYTCPWKGVAQYHHLFVGDEKIEDGAWSYPNPKEAAKEIAGFLAFDLSKGIEVIK